MVELGNARRALLAKLLSEAANLALATLVFGQVLSGRSFSIAELSWGAGLWFTLAGAALAVAGRK